MLDLIVIFFLILDFACMRVTSRSYMNSNLSPLLLVVNMHAHYIGRPIAHIIPRVEVMV